MSYHNEQEHQGHAAQMLIWGIATMGLFLLWEYVLVPVFWKVILYFEEEPK